MHSQLEQVKKQKTNSDKNNRMLEEQLNELRGKVSQLEDDLSSSEQKNSKVSGESAGVAKQLEDAEHQLGMATKQIKSLEAALAEAKSSADDESRVRFIQSWQ